MGKDNLNNCEKLEKVFEDWREIYTQLLDKAKDNKSLDDFDRTYREGYYSGGLNILEQISHQIKYFPITEVTK